MQYEPNQTQEATQERYVGSGGGAPYKFPEAPKYDPREFYKLSYNNQGGLYN